MNTFQRDLQYTWNKPGNALARIIILNVGVFVFVNLAMVFMGDYFIADEFLSMPVHFSEVIYKPWTIITSVFTHTGVFHLFFNMLSLYYFGLIINQFINPYRLIGIFLLGGVIANLCLLGAYASIPFFIERGETVRFALGASGGIFAIIVAAATLVPDYKMNLMLFGPVKIKYLAAIFVFFALIGIRGGNAGGDFAHIMGALVGFAFIHQLRNGRDWSRMTSRIVDFLDPNVKKSHKGRMKVAYKKKSGGGRPGRAPKNNSRAGGTYTDMKEQEVIDAILDKISDIGYDNLSKDEKQLLFKLSQKKDKNKKK